ncbi:MAG: M48 family metallopeptidase [Planctomycetaceae bacterium]
MDFFAQQDAARRKTGLLVFYFILATAFIIAAIYGVFVAAFLYGRQHRQSHLETAAPMVELWHPELFLAVAGGTLAVILGGSAFKTASLNGGGESVARQLGGRPLPPDTADPDERRLLNVVEEMALASGTPVPTVFVLEDERSINAFAAGYTPGDAVIGVTRGTLEHLDRDELQGVIAHEFSHILNGDMRLNIRLIGLLHGILLIALIGYVLVRSAAVSSSSYRSRRSRNNSGAALLLFGAALIAIGYIGVFFGRLIKSAVSRQREYLADASAVQFTRNPEGIGGALKKIGGLARGSRIQDGHAEEASHLFFGNALRQSMFGLLATHPPLDVRIKRIDPSFDGKFPRVESHERPAPEDASPASIGPRTRPIPGIGFAASESYRGSGTTPTGSPPPPRGGFDSAAVMATIGAVRSEHLNHARAMLASIPDEVRAAVHDPHGAQAVIFLLLLDDDRPVRRIQREWLDEHAPPDVRARIAALQSHAENLPAAARVPLVEMVFPALRALEADEYARFRKNVEAMVRADRRLALFEYTLRRMLLRHLDAHFDRKKPVVVQYYALRPLLDECAALLSALAHVGHKDPGEAARAFQTGARLLDSDGAALRLSPREWCNLDVVDPALAKLAETSPAIKKRVLTAALACVTADRQVTVAEGELLRAVADALDCPMPPLLSGVEG